MSRALQVSLLIVMACLAACTTDSHLGEGMRLKQLSANTPYYHVISFESGDPIDATRSWTITGVPAGRYIVELLIPAGQLPALTSAGTRASVTIEDADGSLLWTGEEALSNIPVSSPSGIAEAGTEVRIFPSESRIPLAMDREYRVILTIINLPSPPVPVSMRMSLPRPAFTS